MPPRIKQPLRASTILSTLRAKKRLLTLVRSSCRSIDFPQRFQIPIRWKLPANIGKG